MKPCKFKIVEGEYRGRNENKDKRHTKDDIVRLLKLTCNRGNIPYETREEKDVDDILYIFVYESTVSEIYKDERLDNLTGITHRDLTTWQSFIDSLTPVSDEIEFLTGLKELMERTGVSIYGWSLESAFVGLNVHGKEYDELFAPDANGTALVDPDAIAAKIRELRNENNKR